MKLSLFSLVILLIAGLVASEDSVNTTTTSSTEVSTTSTAVPTTTEVPTTSTTVPTTSTEPPTTSTEPPTTTTSSTTSTTVATTTSTKEPVTTLPPPTSTKSPGPEDCPFNITQKNVTCIRADLKMSFIVSLEGKDYPINLGCKANYESSDCSGNDTQTLVLYESTYNFTMVFEKEKDKFSVKEIAFRYNLTAGGGEVFTNSTKLFTVKTGNSYMCKSKSDVHLGNVTIQFLEMHVQAFLTKDETNFGAAEECDADDKVSDVVPIAVGVALAALIIVVLIAYLVGRRRSRQNGYQSV